LRTPRPDNNRLGIQLERQIRRAEVSFPPSFDENQFLFENCRSVQNRKNRTLKEFQLKGCIPEILSRLFSSVRSTVALQCGPSLQNPSLFRLGSNMSEKKLTASNYPSQFYIDEACQNIWVRFL